MQKENQKTAKAASAVQYDSQSEKGLNNILKSLRSTGHKEDSPEVKQIIHMIADLKK
jgi:hypothetical protein